MQPNNGLIFKVLGAGGDIPLTVNQKMVLLVLLNHWNPKNFGAVVWPGHQRIADLSRISRRAAQDALYGLEATGFIKIVREPGRSNRYTLITDLIESATRAADARPDAEVAQDARGGAQEVRDGRAGGAHECLIEPHDKALRHSANHRDMSHLGVVAGMAVNPLNKKKQK